MDSIRQGLIPAEMEDKWFVYWADAVLYFHRSWTGCCIYVVRFVADGEGWRMTEAQVNRDPEQYCETDDAADVRMVSFLIDRLLLRGAGQDDVLECLQKHVPGVRREDDAFVGDLDAAATDHRRRAGISGLVGRAAAAPARVVRPSTCDLSAVWPPAGPPQEDFPG